MRKRIYTTLAGLAVAVTLLTGCGEKPGASGDLPTVTKTPVSASEQQADGATVAKRAEELAGQVAVTIGDFDITMDHMMMFILSMEKTGAQYENYYQTYYNTSFWDMAYDESGITMREVYKDYVMNSAVQYGILYQEALKSGQTLTAEEETENDTFVNTVFESLTAGELEKAGFTRSKLRETADIMTLAEKQYNFMIENFGIDEEEVFASVNKEDYKEYETEYLYLSTASYDDSFKLIERTDAEKAEDYAYMLTLLSSLKEGATMEELANTDPDSQLTYTTRTFLANTEEVDPAYVEAAAALSNGAYSDVVETRYGFYIIKMVNNDCTDSYMAALDDAYGAKVDELFTEAFTKLEEQYGYTVNEEVWDALEFGSIIVDSVE